MENRNGLVVDVSLTLTTGKAEREAALEMIGNLPGRSRVTVGADKAYDTDEFVANLREMNVTPHVAQNNSHRPAQSTIGQHVTEGTKQFNASANASKKSSVGQKLSDWLVRLGFADCSV
jgi:hypothetical protein